ncbi:MAG: sigma-70 family RNA polymerase sigma factor [Thermoleophilia bacterium]|nr:sigma-70 family RNA polymerase sigma factor [Thermoleophilia bacterium]
MTTDHRTDAAIVAESLRRPEAFAALFDRHFDRIHGYLSRRFGPQAAADAASETFLVAFRRRGSYDPARVDALPWLFGIAVRVARSQRRTERRMLRATGVHDAPPEDPHATVDARLGAGEREALRRALAGLRRQERDALTLFALADLTYEEIAVALGTTPGTVASRIFRARSRLSGELAALRPALANPKEAVDA